MLISLEKPKKEFAIITGGQILNIANLRSIYSESHALTILQSHLNKLFAETFYNEFANFLADCGYVVLALAIVFAILMLQ